MLECSSVYPYSYGSYHNYQNCIGSKKYNYPTTFQGYGYSYQNNQKVGFWEGLKTLAKGVIKPIMNIVQHPIKSALGIGAITALIIGTGGAATPFLIALGLGIGGYQTGKGIYNFVKSDTRYETLAALEDIGEGSFTLAASAFGAKAFKGSASATTAAADKTGALAKTGTYIEGLAKDSWDVLKLAPSSAQQTASTVLSGEFVNNIKPSITAVKLNNANTKIQKMVLENKTNTPAYTQLLEQRNMYENFLKNYGNGNICENVLNLNNKLAPWKNTANTNLVLGLNNYIPDDSEVIGTAQYLYPNTLNCISQFA